MLLYVKSGSCASRARQCRSATPPTSRMKPFSFTYAGPVYSRAAATSSSVGTSSSPPPAAATCSTSCCRKSASTMPPWPLSKPVSAFSTAGWLQT